MNRKYRLALLSLLALTALRAADMLTGQEFIYGLGITVGAYIAGNVGQKIGVALASKAPTP